MNFNFILIPVCCWISAFWKVSAFQVFGDDNPAKNHLWSFSGIYPIEKSIKAKSHNPRRNATPWCLSLWLLILPEILLWFLVSDLISKFFSLPVDSGQKQHVPYLAYVSVYHKDKRIRHAGVSNWRYLPSHCVRDVNGASCFEAPCLKALQTEIATAGWYWWC